MLPRHLTVAVVLTFTAVACSGGGPNTVDTATPTDPLAFEDGSVGAATTTTATDSEDEAGDQNDLDPVIVEGLAQAVVADQSGQNQGVAITIDEARCLSARTVLALGVDRLASLRLIDGGLGTAIAILSADERAVLVDATLECVPLESLIGGAGLDDQDIACLAAALEETALMRELALGQLSGNGAGLAALAPARKAEYLDAIRTCVDLADVMFADTEVSPASAGCVSDAVRDDPLLDEVFDAVAVGEPVGGETAAALRSIVDRCLTLDELAALP